ncbi:MAG: Kelch repeat-containing protein [Planctomycetota bacterium]|jgi:N-acetylneuraminic acid mutarotase
MPTPRIGLSTSVVDGIIYAIGGSPAADQPAYATVEAYNPETDSWTRKAPMPTPRALLSTSVVDGIIYAIGGGRDLWSTLSTVEAYDPATNTWTTKRNMPTPRGALSTGVVDGIIYAIGGTTVNQYGSALATVEAYDPVTDTWTTKSDMPGPKDGFSTCVVDSIIYAIGGGFNHPTDSTVKAYDPKTDTWTEKDDMPTARAGLSTCGMDGIIYAIGGRITEFGFLSAVEAYDPATNTWVTKTDMPTARSWLSSSTVDGKIYAIGGLHGGSAATVEEYDPSSDLGPRLDGAWVIEAPSPLGGKIFHTSFFTAQDADGLRYTVVMEHSECSITVWGAFPEATKKTDMVGMAVKTGPTTSKGTLVGYGVKAGELEEELVYIEVASYEGTLVDENTLELTATQSFYMPEQDADGDGFPDEGELPVLCTPYTVPSRRVTLVPMCELTPPPNGQ